MKGKVRHTIVREDEAAVSAVFAHIRPLVEFLYNVVACEPFAFGSWLSGSGLVMAAAISGPKSVLGCLCAALAAVGLVWLLCLLLGVWESLKTHLKPLPDEAYQAVQDFAVGMVCKIQARKEVRKCRREFQRLYLAKVVTAQAGVAVAAYLIPIRYVVLAAYLLFNACVVLWKVFGEWVLRRLFEESPKEKAENASISACNQNGPAPSAVREPSEAGK